MNIVFISNYFNHHQKEFSDCISSYDDISYTFVATSKVSDERKKLGYGNWEIPDYVLEFSSYDNSKLKKIIDNADVIILGMAPERLVKKHIKAGKILFRYTERPFKSGINKFKLIPQIVKWHLCNPFYKPIYILCAGAYTSYDFTKLGMFKNKFYKWGYFPGLKVYSDFNESVNKKCADQILWCGRFLDWKHPDDALKVAKKLKDSGYNFHMNFIGAGPMSEKLKQMVNDFCLNEYVTFLGAMSPESVRKYMESSGIFLATSDYNEGWGAVINESMNSGCAVIASHAVGSAPYLIDDSQNGYIYESGNIDELYEKTAICLKNKELQLKLGYNAYCTITNEWNAKVASQRLRCIINEMLKGKKSPDLYESGPCSKARVIKNNWYPEKTH